MNTALLIFDTINDIKVDTWYKIKSELDKRCDEYPNVILIKSVYNDGAFPKSTLSSKYIDQVMTLDVESKDYWSNALDTIENIPNHDPIRLDRIVLCGNSSMDVRTSALIIRELRPNVEIIIKYMLCDNAIFFDGPELGNNKIKIWY